jgi:O-antigen ligase
LAKADPVSAFVRTLAWVTHLIFGLVVFDIMARRGQSSRASTIWGVLVAGLVLHAVGLIIFVALVPDPKSYSWTGMLYGVTNIRQLGFYSASGYALSLGLALSANNPRTRIVAASVAASMIAFSFWSGTRGSIIAVMAAALITFLVVPSLRTRFTIALALASLAGGIPLAMIYRAPDPYLGVERIFRDVELKNTFAPELRLGRMGLWKGALRGIVEKPLFGHGESQFRLLVKENEGVFNHPHNSFLQVAYQWGLVGAALFFLLLAAAGARLVRIARSSPNIGVPALLTFLSLFVMSLVEGSLYHTWPVMFLVFVTAAAIGLGERTLTR